MAAIGRRINAPIDELSSWPREATYARVKVRSKNLKSFIKGAGARSRVAPNQQRSAPEQGCASANVQGGRLIVSGADGL
jgi:hypothetical protein